jgi:monoamine oxidase
MSLSLFVYLHRTFAPRWDGLTRRELFRATLIVAGGHLLSESYARAVAPPTRQRRTVLVVGAGLGGLAAAYELAHVGYDVRVVEARNRVGGRVLSFNDLVRGKIVEGGGELVGANHPTWLAYARRFGLKFLDVNEDGRGEGPLELGGKRIAGKALRRLWRQMRRALPRLNEDAAKIDAFEPWKSPNAQGLDRRSLGAWIAGLKVREQCRAGLTALLTSAMGVLPAWKSYLGHLALIKGGGLERFWTDSEAYRCAGGTQQLAHKLAAALGAGRLSLNTPVTAIQVRERSATVTLGTGERREVDDVVLAVPPSTWARIAFDPPLPAQLRPQMGASIKFLVAVKSRFWREAGQSSEALTDGPIGLTWDNTAGQAGAEGPACLTAYSGGPHAETILGWPANERAGKYLDLLEGLYPGMRKAQARTRFVNWVGDPWTRGGYSVPAPGEVTTVGPILHDGLGRLHFAGEHACPAFQGYMEGALQSGARLARRLARRDGVVK